MKYPNLFLVGTPKAGTTSLHDSLSVLPNVQSGSIKEPHHFAKIGANVKSVRSLTAKEYLASYDFTNPNIKYWLDSSVSYLHQPSALKEIKRMCRDPKIVIMLRDPIRRMHSHWLMDVRDGLVRDEFREAVLKDIAEPRKGFGFSHMYVELSLYFDAVDTCMKIFGRQNVFVGVFEDYVENTERFMGELLTWLNLRGTEYVARSVKKNPASVPRNKAAALLYHNMDLRRTLKKFLPNELKDFFRSILLQDSAPLKMCRRDHDEFSHFFKSDICQLKKQFNIGHPSWGKYVQ